MTDPRDDVLTDSADEQGHEIQSPVFRDNEGMKERHNPKQDRENEDAIQSSIVIMFFQGVYQHFEEVASLVLWDLRRLAVF